MEVLPALKRWMRKKSLHISRYKFYVTQELLYYYYYLQLHSLDLKNAYSDHFSKEQILRKHS